MKLKHGFEQNEVKHVFEQNEVEAWVSTNVTASGHIYANKK